MFSDDSSLPCLPKPHAEGDASSKFRKYNPFLPTNFVVDPMFFSINFDCEEDHIHVSFEMSEWERDLLKLTPSKIGPEELVLHGGQQRNPEDVVANIVFEPDDFACQYYCSCGCKCNCDCDNCQCWEIEFRKHIVVPYHNLPDSVIQMMMNITRVAIKNSLPKLEHSFTLL